MARVQGLCACTKKDCETHEIVGAGVQSYRNGWVDAISSLCRKCESSCAKGLNSRWGTRVL